MELDQKLTKHSQKMLDAGRLHEEKKYLCKNLGVKEGGGRLLEGDVFSGAYSIITILNFKISWGGIPGPPPLLYVWYHGLL